MHQPIHRFEQSGTILDDKYFAIMKQRYVEIISEQMREQGYVQRFDIDPDWSLSWLGDSYDFKLSVYGVYVGKKRARCIKGMAGNLPVAFTAPIKSDEPSETQGSESVGKSPPTT